MALLHWLAAAATISAAIMSYPAPSLAQKSDPIATRLGLTPDKGVLAPWTKPETESERQLGRFVRSSMLGVILLGDPGKGLGTAFVISKKHRILATNAHVADIAHFNDGKMSAVLNNSSKTYDVKNIWYNPGLLRVDNSEASNLHVLRWSTTVPSKVSETRLCFAVSSSKECVKPTF